MKSNIVFSEAKCCSTYQVHHCFQLGLGHVARYHFFDIPVATNVQTGVSSVKMLTVERILWNVFACTFSKARLRASCI